ncbi:hypothetical protein SPRG_00991 [Saprolegnia parasitica CBS 223.65]|uniref:Uncharacterized protein n=1 Tax=Saprolegnia parasitica (strain CBS 223.65) TaxID=695850 RepID=A0A067CW34_SAPPC|nr:hypothetical protein SPRG_00991 [Saprolegnia parasitica CBS 223.65]KDO34929.1 hypothetical protein SPRG_00991 [Saprolegnia parasitica CBS 223.65]|eukprot:XP_012194585.1 hypothetical protein SPRG_00991 [Saprolegnia parasitica CBS 223.65]
MPSARRIRVATELTRRRRVRGQGMALSLLCLLFATLLAVCTYVLSRMANTPVFMGLNIETFTSNQFNIPINALLQASDSVLLSIKNASVDASISLSDLHYKECAMQDKACARAFLPRSNDIWRLVARSFALIPNFDQPRFQNATQTIKIQHINNLSGWNKATAQFSLAEHDVAITCMPRRASFYPAASPASSATVDTLAFCSQRKFDPDWICENDVPLDANTYAIQVSHGQATYIGVAARRQVYLNPGHVATFTGGLHGDMRLGPVEAIDEYDGGIVQVLAPWDVLPFGSCATLNTATGLGWLMDMQGYVTLLWTCESIFFQSALVLWLLTVYLVLLQFVFLRHSVICCVPVYLSKNVIGPVILLLSFYGDRSLQTLSTYMYQNPSFGKAYLVYIGPAQLASIVGIMTGTLIQIWFNPRLVTQTWLLLVASVVNWVLVFCLEAFVVAPESNAVPSTCRLATSINCFAFDAIPRLYWLSPLVSGSVVFVAIGCVYLNAKSIPYTVRVPRTNSVLQYLGVSNLSSVTTSIEGCTSTNVNGDVVLDRGLLLVKNMLHVSDAYVTRTCNVQYELFYRLLPSARLQRIFSQLIGSVLVVHVHRKRIQQTSSYKHLHELNISGMPHTPGYLS